MITRLLAILVIAALLLPGSFAPVPENATEQTRQAQQTQSTAVKAAETEAQVPAAETAAAQAPAALLTQAEAEAIALNHAGLTAAEVTRLHTKYDVDDGVPEYEVEFRHGDWEYDYKIHAETGALLHWDKEYDLPKVKEPKPTEPPATEPPAAVRTLTAGEAEAIALEHAGLTASEVTRLHTEYDVDDGVPEYEVEFRAGKWEYEYEIHAETGKILSWEKDD